MNTKRRGFFARLGAAAGRLGSRAFGGGREEGPAPGSVLQEPEIQERPDGLLLWLLADTAAEAGPAPAIAEELSRRLGEPVHVLITTTLSEPLCPGVAERAIHQLAPQNRQGEAQLFLDHWSPDFGVFVGTPARGLLAQAAVQRRIPMFHAFGERQPEASGRFPAYLGDFDICLAPSAALANLLRAQFKSDRVRVEISGPLSDTAYALPANAAETDELAALLGGRPVWLAAGIMPGEAELIEAAHRKSFRSAHRLLLMIVPRSPGDADAIAAHFEGEGWQVARRSREDEPDPDVQVYLADTDGELGLWYRLAPVSFMGGTFQPEDAPADPFAPAALGSAVLHGPFTGDSPWRYQRLDSQNASVLVRNADELGEAIITFLAPDKAASLAQAGWAVTTESAHVVERLVALMEEHLDAREGVL